MIGRVADAIREIVQYDIPAMAEFDGRPFVQRTDCSVEEEILLLLHYAGDSGLSRRDLGRCVTATSSAVTKALGRLTAGNRREVIELDGGNIRLTGAGVVRVLDQLGPKLTL